MTGIDEVTNKKRPLIDPPISSGYYHYLFRCVSIRSLHYGVTGYAVTRKTSLEVGRLSPERRASREKKKEKVKKEKKKRKN